MSKACISRHVAAAPRDMPQSATFSRFGVLDVLSSTTPRPSGRKRHISPHLAGLATRRGEKCRLTCRAADNPFASHHVEALRFRSQGLVWRDLVQRINDLGGRVAIVGPKGSGKTTLLEELARRLEEPVVVVRIPGSCPDPWPTTRAQLPHSVTHRHAILVDGSEKLGAIGRRLLLHTTRRAHCLILTLHRRGPLPALIDCSTDPGLLRNLVEELMPTDSATLELGLEDLHRRHGGNIRLCFWELYDVYAGRVRIEA